MATAAVSLAVPITPEPSPDHPGGSLTEFGPTAEHGFPAWYRDSNGIRLEACTTLDDPLCSTLPDEVPNPDVPVSYPDNFPGEFFYQLAGAEVVGDGVNMGIGMDLEGAWAAEEVVEGDQMVFGRIRIRDKDIADGTYRVTHPYGIDEFVAAGEGINYTQDIGTTPGVFGEAMSSRVGPFLTWDTFGSTGPDAPPAGYVGDPGVNHKITGSPYDTNFVKVERINDDGTVEQLAYTDLFSIQGRLAVNAGVEVQLATYSVGQDGKGAIDVYATSDANQAIEVDDEGDALGLIATGMRGSKGVYYGRYALDGSAVADGKTLTVTNVGDNPVAQKKVTLVDVVTATATYDADAGKLTVTGSSSDKDSTPGTLSVMSKPFDPATNSVTIDTPAPPPSVTVTSDKGGSAVVPVTAAGAGFQPAAPQAAAFADPHDAVVGQQVTLTGTGSTGTIDSYTWTQVDATKVVGEQPGADANGEPVMVPVTEVVPVSDANRVTLSGADSAVATFTAPDAEGPVAFQLVVAGPAGTSQPVKVQVNVVPVPTTPNPDPGGEPIPVEVTADAGADQTVPRGTSVALDASASLLADSYAWTQVNGPTVTLNAANTAKPSFTFPAMALPAQNTTGNPNYVVEAPTPVVLSLTVTGQGGQTDIDEVAVSPQEETVTITRGEYRSGREWRVEGNSSILAGQQVAIVLGPNLTGRVLGYAEVDELGAFSFRAAGNIQPDSTRTVSVVSEAGDSHTGFAVRVR